LEQLIYTLLAYINNSLNKDINYYIAKSLLEHINRIESFSLDTVAEACNVAPSTINRFCKRIGFKNFSNLRNSVAIPMGANMYEKAESGLSTQMFLKQLNENIEVIENIPIPNIDRIVNQIHQSRRIVILGFEKNQIQAMELQKKLFLFGKLCECDTNLFKQIDALSDLSDEDMIITISIQGNILSYHFPITEKLKTAKAKKLLITFTSDLHKLEIFHDILQCGYIKNSGVSSFTLLRMFDVLMDRYQHFSITNFS